MFISTCLGLIWMVLGGLFLWKPAMLLKRLNKKGFSFLLRYILVVLIFGTTTLLSLCAPIPTFWPTLIALIVIIYAWIYAFRWSKKVKGHFAELCEAFLDVKLLKRIALGHILVGIVIIATAYVSNKWFSDDEPTAEPVPALVE